MPAEPDNSKIEELLKRYAKKRREEMGTPIELHPAVRKMLQGEVARQRPAPTPERKGFFSSFLQFWPRFAVAGAAVVLLSLVLVNINQHPNPNEPKEMARASDQLLKKQTKDPSAARDNPPPPDPINGPVAESLFKDRGGVSGEKNDKEVRLQRELKLARNERAPMPTEGDASGRLSGKKPSDKAPDERLKAKVADELTVTRESLDRKNARIPEVRLRLADGAAKADTDLDSYGIPQTGLPSVANPTPAIHPESPSPKPVRARPEPPLAKAEKGQAPAKTVTDQPLGRTDFGLNADALGDESPTARARYYALSQSALGLTTNGVAFTQPTSTSGAVSSTVLAYDTSKQSDLFKSSLGSVTPTAPPTSTPLFTGIQPAQNSPGLGITAPAAAEPSWNYAFFESGRNLPVISAQFANVNRQKGTFADDNANGVRKEAEGWGEGKQAQPLSATFNLQQNGDRIRIVDFDGSVYDGQLLQAGGAVDSEKTLAERQVGAVAESEESSKRGFARAEPQIPFRVSGTNRTVNKLVVLTGIISGDTTQGGAAPVKDGAAAVRGDELAAQAAKPGAAPSALPAQKEQLPQILRASTIKGTVRFDITNQMKIEARRVSP